MSGPQFQHFNNLEASRYEELKRDIEQRGVLIPILTDENGAVIDGHQRRRVCAELHVDCPSVVLPDLSDDEKHQLAIVLNLYRRQLSGVERSKVIGELAHMRLSTRRIGAILGVSQSTVAREVAGLPDRPDTVEGADGNSYPASRPEGESSDSPSTPPPADENGELPGSKPREDEGGSDDAGASGDEGAGSRSSDPAPSTEKGPEERLHDYRKAWFTEQKRAVDHLFQFDPDELAPLLDPDERDVLRSTANAAAAWAERIDRALSPTLTVVNR